MPSWIIQPSGLIEPVPVPEVYCDAVGAIELIDGNCLRIIMITEQLPLEGGGVQRIVTAKLIRPLASIPVSIGQFAKCLAEPERPKGAPILVK